MDLATLKQTSAGFVPEEDDDHGVLDLGTLSSHVRQQVLDRLLSKDFGAWADAVARVGNCVRPVRLRGTSARIDLTTGEVLSSFSTADQSGPPGYRVGRHVRYDPDQVRAWLVTQAS